MSSSEGSLSDFFGGELIPIVSMYGIFSYIYHKNQSHVGKYTIHESYGLEPHRTQDLTRACYFSPGCLIGDIVKRQNKFIRM